MTLLKFIEYQKKKTILNRAPISLKIAILLYVLFSIFLPLEPQYVEYSLVGIIAIQTILMLICYRDPIFIMEVYFAYASLFIFSYLSVLLYNVDVNALIYRLLYIYSVAFSTIFLFATTRVKDLENFLRKIRIPESIINYFVLTWNLIPSTYQELQTVKITQAARGMEIGKNPISRLKTSILIFIPFLYLLLLRSRLLEISLKARGID